ncbi:MAG: cytochrome c oxidase subunit 3 [Candidatus Binatia bacterium]
MSRGPAGSNAVFGMLIFLGAESMFFAGLVSAFMVLRGTAGGWPPPGQPRLPVEVTAVNTLVLLLSGWTVVRARNAIRRGQPAALVGELSRTTILGALFLAIQGIEWVGLFRHGLTIRPGVYGGLFCTLIGCHGLHVLGGLGALLVALAGARRGRFSARDHAGVTAVHLYWLFVVGIWPILYTLVYLW